MIGTSENTLSTKSSSLSSSVEVVVVGGHDNVDNDVENNSNNKDGQGKQQKQSEHQSTPTKLTKKKKLQIDDQNNHEEDHQQQQQDQTPKSSSSTTCSLMKFFNVKSIIGLLLLSFIIFVAIDSTKSIGNGYIKSLIEDFLDWIQYDNPIGGIFVFTLVCCITTILFIPGVLLTVGAGYVFSITFDSLPLGIIVGTITYFVGACIGSIVSFTIGKFLLRDCVQTTLIPKFQILNALDSTLIEKQKGLRIMFLLRLSPLIYVSPYLNYGIGATGISLYSFVMSLTAVLPATILYVFLGASAKSLLNSNDNESDADTENEVDGSEIETDEENNTLTTIVLIVGIVLTVIAVGLTSYYAKTELDKMLNRSSAPDNANNDDGDDDDSIGHDVGKKQVLRYKHIGDRNDEESFSSDYEEVEEGVLEEISTNDVEQQL